MAESAIRPETDVRKEFMEGDPEGSFVMVNFLKFKPGGGSKEYSKYGEAFAKLLESRGGKFIYRGRVAQKFVGDDDWHAIALVEYPSRKVFYEVTTSDEYLAIHDHREDGLEKTLVYATVPMPA